MTAFQVNPFGIVVRSGLLALTLFSSGCDGAAGDEGADASTGGHGAGGDVAGGGSDGGHAAGGGSNGGHAAGGHGGPGIGTLDYDAVVEGCAKLVACGLPAFDKPNWLRLGVPGYHNGLNICVGLVADALVTAGNTNDEGIAYAHVVACAAAEASCDGFLACLEFDYDDADCSAGVAARCDGPLLLSCSASGTSQYIVTDCRDQGQNCQEVGGVARCTLGTPCQAADPVTCDAEGGVVACDNGALTRRPCPPGWACNAEPGQPPCLPTGPACDMPGQRRCSAEGNLISCLPIGGGQNRETTEDCRIQQKVCDPAEFYCAPAATECDEGVNDTCLEDGSGLSGCANGVLLTVPCARLGRTTCTYNAGHASCE